VLNTVRFSKKYGRYLALLIQPKGMLVLGLVLLGIPQANIAIVSASVSEAACNEHDAKTRFAQPPPSGNPEDCDADPKG